LWILTRTSFLSIVRHEHDATLLLVRARRVTDITTLWPEAEVAATPSADYGFRAAIPEDQVVAAVTEQLRAIRYTTDFKGGVKDSVRHDAYMKVWGALRALVQK
jgi:hypothetical protein